MDEYYLDGKDFIELHDLLKVLGLCESGGMAKTAIAQGRVSVDSIVEFRKRRKVRAGHTVEFNDCKIVIR